MVTPRRTGPFGFTLIELLVVMAVLALLLSVAIPRYFGHVDKAKESVLRQNLAQLRTAIDQHFGDLGRYPESLDDVVNKNYLRKIPQDPLTERADTWVLVSPPNKQAGKVFDVRSGAPGKSRDGSEYASW